MRSTVLDFTGKKLALWFIAHQFVVGHHPLYVLSHVFGPQITESVSSTPQAYNIHYAKNNIPSFILMFFPRSWHWKCNIATFTLKEAHPSRVLVECPLDLKEHFPHLLQRALTPNCSDLLPTWTENGVSTTLCYYDLSSLVDCHPPGIVEPPSCFDRGTNG